MNLKPNMRSNVGRVCKIEDDPKRELKFRLSIVSIMSNNMRVLNLIFIELIPKLC